MQGNHFVEALQHGSETFNPMKHVVQTGAGVSMINHMAA